MNGVQKKLKACIVDSLRMVKRIKALKAFRGQTDGGVEQFYTVCRQEFEKQRFAVGNA